MKELNATVAADLNMLEGEAVTDYVPPASSPGAATAGLENLETAELCTMAVGMLFAVIAGRRGDHWNLTAEESARLGAATGRVLDKYLPNMKAGPEAALVLAAVLIVAPRLAQDKAGGSGAGKSEHVSSES